MTDAPRLTIDRRTGEGGPVPRSAPRSGGEGGFTLLEVMISAAILTVIYFGICIGRWKTMIKTRVILHRINRYEKELAASEND